jgi:type IV pilus assembly protein PilB
MIYTRLGDILVENGTITQAQLKEGLALQKKTGMRLGEVLQEEGIVTEGQVIDALVAQLGLEFIDLNTFQIPSEMAQLLPKRLAEKHKVVPVKANHSDIYLAMADPLNFIAAEEVAAATGRHVIPMIAAKSAVERAALNLYSNQSAIRAMEDMRKDLAGRAPRGGIPGQRVNPLSVDQEDAETAPAIRLVNAMIERACREDASDIHLEPTEGNMRIRMRIDGILRQILTVPRELQASVISRLKIMGRMDIARKNLPQDGRANVLVGESVLDLRISTLPTIYGEKAVVRLLRQNPALISMEGIGLFGRNLEKFRNLIEHNTEGVILMVGPTGSGKTSTLYTMIDYLKGEEINLISLEDPVEYHMDDVCQVQINERSGLTFANALRAVLRQDPDMIAVGEIRDGETARIAMQAAMTGHLVLSTIHTNNAVSSIDRLQDIGVEPYLIAGAVKGIVSQRLLRRVCPYCKQPYTPSVEEVDLLGLPEDGDYTFYRGSGCEECFQTGYRGRIGAFEILSITPDIRHAIHDRKAGSLERAVESSDFLSIKENCADLVQAGVTTVDEVIRAIGREQE